MTSVLFAKILHMSKNKEYPPCYGGEWPDNEDHGAFVTPPLQP